MPLSLKQLNDVCLVGDDTWQRCRYLAEDEDEMGKYYCVKKVKAKRDVIDAEIASFVRDTRKKGKDPKAENIPLGDNCGGYPIFKHVETGYDKD